MNQDQILSGLRWALAVLGTLAASKGITPAEWGHMTDLIVTIVTAAIPLGALVWGHLSHTDEAKVAAASALPQVKAMTLSDPALAAAAKAADPQTKIEQVTVQPQR